LSAKKIPAPDPKLPDDFISNAMVIVFRFATSRAQVLRFCTYTKLQNNCFEICTYKNKELKTYCNQHLQKNRARAGPFHYYETAGSAPARIAFGPDEDSG
jgi:hypothetical protein